MEIDIMWESSDKIFKLSCTNLSLKCFAKKCIFSLDSLIFGTKSSAAEIEPIFAGDGAVE